MSREAVEQAYDALAGAGLVPSVRTVREKLGDTGSLTTIAGHLRSIEVDRAHGPGIALPDALVRGLIDGAGELWRDVAAAAEAQVEAINGAADSKIAAMRAESDEAIAQAALVSHELGASRATVASLERHVDDSTSRAGRLEAQLDEARAATQAVEAASGALREERDALKHELDLVRAQVQTERATFETRQAERLSRIEALQAAAKKLRALHAEEVQALDARLDGQATRISDLATVIARGEEKLAAAVSRAKQSEERAARSESAIQQSDIRHERAMAELIDARRVDLLACHARIEQLSNTLIEARLRGPELVADLPTAEFQQGLAFDDDLDGTKQFAGNDPEPSSL